MGSSADSTSEDGWTTIARGRKGGAATAPNRDRLDNRLDKDATLADLQKAFARHGKTWKQSTCREKLLHMLKQNQSEAVVNIGTTVVLASGSFSTMNVEGNKRSMLQFACAVDVAREMEKLADTEIRIFAQDPAYSDIDKEFCASLGVTVLHATLYDQSLGPAKDLLGPRTVLFEFFMSMEREGVLDLLRAENRLYIGSSLSGYSRSGWTPPQDRGVDVKTMAEEWVKTHAQRRFPGFLEDEPVFMGLMVYWKEPQDED